LRTASEDGALFPGDEVAEPGGERLNLSGAALDYLAGVGAEGEEEALFFHALAVLHAPTYAAENAGALRQNWPRVPLPESGEVLRASAGLGRRVAALLDPETPMAGVTSGTPRPELRPVGFVGSEGGGPPDLGLRAGWGHRGKVGAVMPGRGRAVQRAYTAGERAAIEEGAALLGLSAGEEFAALGEATYDVYLNDRAWWANVPEGA
jgi:hypothetical protein